MEERERILRLWFDMWLQQQNLGIESIFAEDVVYVESWGPRYQGRDLVKHWFEEWNTRGKVEIWEIRQFFHKGSETVVEWYFQNRPPAPLRTLTGCPWWSGLRKTGSNF